MPAPAHHALKLVEDLLRLVDERPAFSTFVSFDPALFNLVTRARGLLAQPSSPSFSRSAASDAPRFSWCDACGSYHEEE